MSKLFISLRHLSMLSMGEEGSTRVAAIFLISSELTGANNPSLKMGTLSGSHKIFGGRGIEGDLSSDRFSLHFDLKVIGECSAITGNLPGEDRSEEFDPWLKHNVLINLSYILQKQKNINVNTR